MQGEAVAASPETTVEAVMRVGPVTVRPDEDLAELVERLRAAHVASVLVTTSEGRLAGLLRWNDAEQRLAADCAESGPSQG
ncbi:MAG TPA: CBS domain-containing protein [Thermomicrobiales bacterium]